MPACGVCINKGALTGLIMLNNLKCAFKDIPYMWWFLQFLTVFAITMATSKSFLGAYFTAMLITVLFSVALKYTTGQFLFEGISNARQGKNY